MVGEAKSKGHAEHPWHIEVTISQFEGTESRRNLLTVALEDYYQVGAFNRLIQHGQWYRFETRLAHSTRRTLDLLDSRGLQATFFVLGWVAERLPELVREVADRGHELASKGYYHRNVRQMTPGEFRDDLVRAREVIEQAAGTRVIGYRMADGWFGQEDLWALDVLAEEHYEYDSSVAPMFRRFASEPWRQFAHPHLFGERVLWEFPISTTPVLGWNIPIAGGNWFRQLPHSLVRRAVDRWMRTYSAPFVLYFHVWELDPDQPVIRAAPWLTRIRQYRGLKRMPQILSYYLDRYRFTSVAEYLGMSRALPERSPRPALPARLVPPKHATSKERRPLTIVVPCYNEELILPYLANTLKSVEASLGQEYDLQFVFVDDGSTDETWKALQDQFGNRSNFRLHRHDRNRGVAAGIMTGIREADTEVVCSIDCDCTYDPHELREMLPLLADDVDMVTASPYHSEGTVRNVPQWRLVLSRGLSGLYRLILRQKLATYTSCFRVYRRQSVVLIDLDRSGFLGIAEMLGRIDLAGGRIVEYPTTLEVRMLGRSKMKILRTIVGHLQLLVSLTWLRLSGPPAHRSKQNQLEAEAPTRQHDVTKV